MINDTVIITANSVHIKTGAIVCYLPKLNENKDPMVDSHGTLVEIKKLGYVNVGEQGTVVGAPRLVSTQFLEKRIGEPEYHLPGSTIDMVPVLIHKYKTVAWFPMSNIQTL